MRAKKKVVELLGKAGIKINGAEPWDITVHDERFYERIIAHGSLGLGETYMEGWWDCARVDLFIEKLLRAKLKSPITFQVFAMWLKARLFNLQSLKGAQQVIKEHYDLSNELYLSFLDPYNQYSCGYFKDTESLDVAQVQKMDLICRKLNLKKGDTVLDIGCGWGGFAKYASEKYGCSVTGLTISKEQAEYAKKFTTGLPVDIQVVDYRAWGKSGQKYDKIVSIGMVEHVGCKNHKEFFDVVNVLLKDEGLFLLHTIGHYRSMKIGEPWLDKYIFKNGVAPSIEQVGKASAQYFIMEDWHNFGPYYAKTLCAWDENLKSNWSHIKDNFSETFYRMFHYYFLSCAGIFRARKMNLWQIVFSKGAKNEVYTSVR